MQSETGKGRSSKSQGHPACLPCRRRKSRCKFEPGSQACLMCRAHESNCVMASGPELNPRPPSTQQARGKVPTPRKRAAPDAEASQEQDAHVRVSSERRLSLATPHALSSESQPALTALAPQFPGTPSSLFFASTPAVGNHPLALDEAEDDSPHIMGPAVARDRHLLEDYLSIVQAGNRTRTIRPALPGIATVPVVFTKVQKRPIGVAMDPSPSHAKLQVITKLLEPYREQVVNMYLNKANSCFPILDESFFVEPSIITRGRISPAVLACLYAHSIIYWQHDPELSRHHHPDGRFIWNLALEALYSELHLSPGMPSIIAILLNVGGRPTTTMIGNGMLLGSAISLAHCLGLNRNPITWDIPDQEKNLRTQIWWCLVIHDRWSSLMYGTPPHIRQNHHDVPVPNLIRQKGSQGNETAADERIKVFEALASLTEALGPYLEQLYSVRTRPHSRFDRIGYTLNLNSWIDTLSGKVRTIIIRGTDLDVPGAANLRLCFLAAKFFSRRVDLNTEMGGTVIDQISDDKLFELRGIVEEIVVFLHELTPKQLGDFWLPTVAFVFSSTITFLVRLAVQVECNTSGPSQGISLSLAKDMVASLRSYKEEYGWELGDICVNQYGELVENLFAQQSAGLPDGGWVDATPGAISDPAFLESLFTDQWDPILWGQQI
ncbi:unnamed protein product [Clonostachys byssicola]|uniref:Zn(2)-C6 fungal-type domain-containing protein n=1 Tax=Clonostachys byssicola TaxID=160290 RepID=A0A9N9Y7Y6_9HYPO|nr:unnamed protein product [Clonostachys byssicola]